MRGREEDRAGSTEEDKAGAGKGGREEGKEEGREEGRGAGRGAGRGGSGEWSQP